VQKPFLTTLTIPHALLAVAVMAVWGSNFVVIEVALEALPPLFFAALRFFLVAFPLVFILKRPAVPWSQLAAYGVLIGAGQFGLLYIALKSDISPGLASLVVQVQVFFTIGLSMFLTGERVRIFQWVALAVATLGIAVILDNTGGDATPLGLALVLLAALSWAGGNIVARAGGPVNMLAYIAWSSLFAFPPLVVLSLLFEGWPAIRDGVLDATAVTWGAVVYQSVANSMFGYGVWGYLLARYPTATVSPMALLVPVFGIAASAWFLHETLPPWKLLAAALVMGGLAINVFWPMVRPAAPARPRDAPSPG
jgi:O-acetylserine/cysteine efflux transporter